MELDACEISRWDLFKLEFDNLSPEAFEAQLKAEPEAILLDVRTENEFQSGHLDGAIHLNYFDYDLIERIEKLDPQKPYFIYCRSGRRSIRVCVLMRNSGFQHLYHLDGGINAWQQQTAQ